MLPVPREACESYRPGLSEDGLAEMRAREEKQKQVVAHSMVDMFIEHLYMRKT